jgi:hypothetical protein
MDQLGVDYVEHPSGGTLGVFFLGRTVPRLRFRTGLVQSSIGNSAEILRYLWGRYSAGNSSRAEFLRPDPASLKLEAQIDRCGRDLQVWVYYHLLPHRKLTLHVWGADDPAIPGWQRWLLRVLFPVLRILIRRAFSINQPRYRQAIEHVDALLSDSESRLKNQQVSLLDRDSANFVDFSFAAINGLWLQPEEYGGGAADKVRLERSQLPAAMLEDIQSWTTHYPLSAAFINQLYQQRFSPLPRTDQVLRN